jgi:hypothetical protein
VFKLHLHPSCTGVLWLAERLSSRDEIMAPRERMLIQLAKAIQMEDTDRHGRDTSRRWSASRTLERPTYFTNSGVIAGIDQLKSGLDLWSP